VRELFYIRSEQATKKNGVLPRLTLGSFSQSQHERMLNLKKTIELYNKRLPREFGDRDSCQLDNLATIANYYGFPFFLMFINNFGFQPIDSSFMSTSRLDTAMKVKEPPCFDCLRLIHGIRKRIVPYGAAETLRKIALEEISHDRPFILHLDAFLCPWDPFYGKRHNDHVAIVAGYDHGGDVLIINDPYNGENGLNVALETFGETKMYCIFFEADPERTGDTTIWRKIARAHYALMVKGSCVLPQRALEFIASKIRTGELSLDSVKGRDFTETELFENLSQIIFDYSCFGYSLSEMGKNNMGGPLVDKLGRLAFETTNLWKDMLHCLAFAFFKGAQALKEPAVILERIAQLEAEIVRDMIEFTGDSGK
jgi:hypothetical protein